MAWYWILLIVIGAVILFFFLLTFIIYITNGDMKLVEKLYNKLMVHHDKKHQKEDI
ncbi:MAG: hypothetical protein WC148_05235 [Bacilli bacterium]|jgi:hypothetical protein